MALAAGTRLGPYEILSALGSGGMGEVYKAKDTRLDRLVAIKILPQALAVDPHFRDRFDREARAISQLSHPHICALHDIGQQDGTSFLVMQYLEGDTLEARLKKGTLPFGQALQYAMQIAEALNRAHRAGIVHRDLKPGNIMLTKTGAVLLDFGLAKATAPDGSGNVSMLPTTPPNLTTQGTILGTFQYMAPEQLEGQDADARSDIFAFGAVVYEMFTGQKAFAGKSHANLISAILKDQPLLVSARQPLASPLLDRIVTQCLAKDPDERFQSAHDLHSALRWSAELIDLRSVGTADFREQATRDAHGKRVWMVATTVATAAALSLGAASWYLRQAALALPLTRLEIVTPETNDPFSFALSPDGRQLAFVAATDGGPRLWVRSFDQSVPRVLPGTDGATEPFWSPDGTAIGFFADSKLKRVDLAGGAPRVLADAPIPRGGTWSVGDVIVYCPMINSTLMRVSASGGIPTAATQLRPREGTHRWPQFLPDGRHFFYLVTFGQPDARGIYVGSLDGEPQKRVMAADSSAAYSPSGHLLVVSQGSLVTYRFDTRSGSSGGEPIAVAQPVGVDAGGVTGLSGFSVSAAGVLAYRSGATSRRQLVWVDRTGRRLGTIGSADDWALAVPELAPNGQRVAVIRNVQGNPDIWLVDVERAIHTRFTSDPNLEQNPIWSPDGRRIVFTSNRLGHWDLFEKPADGVTDERALLANDQDKGPEDWSPDGRFVLYAVQDVKTGSDLWVLPLTGDRKPFPIAQTNFDEVHGRFSPDGRWLAYVSNETGRDEVYVQPFPGPAQKVQVSIGGGIYPRWRHDGKELFYVGLDNRMVAVPLSGGSNDEIRPGTPVTLFQNPRLTVGGNIGTIGSALARAPYAVAADGRFLLDVIADDGVSSPITIVLNWTAALKR